MKKLKVILFCMLVSVIGCQQEICKFNGTDIFIVENIYKVNDSLSRYGNYGYDVWQHNDAEFIAKTNLFKIGDTVRFNVNTFKNDTLKKGLN